jgi:hypothetical protein
MLLAAARGSEGDAKGQRGFDHLFGISLKKITNTHKYFLISRLYGLHLGPVGEACRYSDSLHIIVVKWRVKWPTPLQRVAGPPESHGGSLQWPRARTDDLFFFAAVAFVALVTPAWADLPCPNTHSKPRHRNVLRKLGWL